jgi:hypothetical protein
LSENVIQLRKKFHRHLKLRVSAVFVNPTSPGNPENMKEGVNRILGMAGYRAGMPAPTCCEVEVVEDGAEITLSHDDQPPFFVASGLGGGKDFVMRFSALPKLLPSKIFGMEQAVRWVELAKFPLTADACDRANRALGDPDGYLSLARLIYWLAEERVPVSDVLRVLEAVAGSVPASGGEAGLWAVLEQTRSALRETSAQYYLDYYGVTDAFHASAELTDAVRSGEGRKAAQSAIARVAGNTNAAFLIIVDDAASRRALWEAAEELFLNTGKSGGLNRPAIVINKSELPEGVRLPGYSREISFALPRDL